MTGDVPQVLLEKMRPHLEWLQAQALLTYYTEGGGKILTGGKGVGFVHTLNIEVKDSYYEVASAIFQQE